MVDLWIGPASRQMVDPVSFISCNYPLARLQICSHYCDFRVHILHRFVVDGRPLFWTWRNTFARAGNMIPEQVQIPLAALFVISVILIGTFASQQSSENSFKNRGISIAGLVFFYLVLYLTSANRKRIVWRTVLVGLLCQYILALFVLRTSVGYDIFNFVSFLARYERGKI
jgi:Na+ dependent nucleoside transporter N-terminus